MHLGGEGLVDNVTLFTLDGSARGKCNLVTIFLKHQFNNPDLNYCCRGKRLFKNSAEFHSKVWRKEMHNH